MTRHVVGIIALTAALIGGFAWLGAYFHELSGAASYDVSSWRGAARGTARVSPEAGRQLWNGRGACMACHSIGDEGVGIRGPNLGVRPPDFTEPVAVRAATRQEGKTAVEHLVEALYDPNAFITPGFEADVMNPVDGPPTMLDDGEIRSLVLYLFQRSGLPTTPELEAEIIEAQRSYSSDVDEEAPATDAPQAPAAGDATAGRAHFERLGCGGCHGPGGEPRAEAAAAPPPELAGDGDAVALLMRIARHPVEPMRPDEAPSTYGATLTVDETWDLAAFLVDAAPAAEETEGSP